MERTEITPIPTPIHRSELLARFARHMGQDGIELVPTSVLAELVAVARACRVSEILIGVLVDPTEPAVARERAFSKIAAKVLFPAARPATCQSVRSHAVDSCSPWSPTASHGTPRRAPSPSAHSLRI